MSVGRKILETAIALVAGSAVSAIVVIAQLPVPQGMSEFQASRLTGAFVLTVFGPFLLPWASGPQPLSPCVIAILVTTAIALVGVYGSWLYNEGSKALLATAAAIWCGVGGYSAWLAISGSI